MSEENILQSVQDEAADILSTMLRMLDLVPQRTDITVVDGELHFQLETEDAGRIIGRNSQNLDALQFLLNRILSCKFDDSPYCVVDVAHYREERKQKLLDDAFAAVERVRENGRSWRMLPLNAMERRIIHQALQDLEDIQTYSEPEDANGRKRLVIRLIQENAPASDSPEAPAVDDDGDAPDPNNA